MTWYRSENALAVSFGAVAVKRAGLDPSLSESFGVESWDLSLNARSQPLSLCPFLLFFFVKKSVLTPKSSVRAARSSTRHARYPHTLSRVCVCRNRFNLIPHTLRGGGVGAEPQHRVHVHPLLLHQRLSLSFSRSLSLAHTHTLSLSLSLFCSLSLSHTHTLTLTLTHTQSISLSLLTPRGGV